MWQPQGNELANFWCVLQSPEVCVVCAMLRDWRLGAINRAIGSGHDQFFPEVTHSSEGY